MGASVLAIYLVSSALTIPVAAQSAPSGALVGAWSTSPQTSLTGNAQFSNQTLRMVVFPHLAGSSIRVRFSNVFGSQSLTIGQANVAGLSSGAATQPGTDRQLTFSGRTSVTIPAGAE